MHRSDSPAEAAPSSRSRSGSRSDPLAARRIVGAIPARYASTRLPGKALREIGGVPMIERVYRQAAQVEDLARVVVLTDDERIVTAVESFGGEVELTPTDCASGTDRIAWAAERWQANEATRVQAVVNIQGDEPLIDPGEIGRIARHLAKNPKDPVVTLAAPGSEEDAENPDVVKVVLGAGGYALYFSRAAIPYPRDPKTHRIWCHLGIYGYQIATLLEIAAAERTPLERTESLEQLRLLENGIPIRVLETARAWWGVDTMDDLRKAEALLAARRPDDNGS